MPLDVEVRTAPTYSVIALTGELDLSTSGALQSALASYDKTTGAVVVDLGAVTFLDSSALRVLVQLRLRMAGAALRLVVTRDNLRRVFDVSGLADVFEIFDSEGAAVESL